MAPAVVHCIRHAQGFHNLGPEFHTLLDPGLTPAGQEQVAVLRESLGPVFLSRINLVTASPLSRTLNTAAIAFKPILGQTDALTGNSSPANGSKCKPDILAIPDVQETSDYPCDTGSDPDVLRKLCSDQSWPVDLSLVKPGWNQKTMSGRWSPQHSKVEARARDARKLLRQKVRELQSEGIESPELVLVAHGGLLHYLTQDWENAFDTYGTGWKNCEVRSYHFVDELENEKERSAYNGGQSDQNYVVETSESRKRRGKEEPMPGREEQERLFLKTMEGWEAQGLQTPLALERQRQAGQPVTSGQGTARTQRDAEGDMEELKKTWSHGSDGNAHTVKVAA